MSRGGRLPIVALVILGVSVICAFLFNLWRPVFVSTSLLGLLLLLVANGFGDILGKISDFAGDLAIGIGKAASWVIMPLIMIIMIDVVTRKIDYIKIRNAEITETYGFSVSFILQDSQWHIHGVLLLLTFGFGYMLNSHVRVDIFREMASRRGQAWIEMFGLTFFAVPFMMVMIGFSWDLFYASFKGWEGSESMVGLGWRWIIKSFLVWGFCVALMAAIATLMRCVNFLFGEEAGSAYAEDKLQFFTDNDKLAKLIIDQNKQGSADGGTN